MLRVLAVAGGVAGAVALSQFPEFSQQYLQRLAGQVDALQAVADQFDASAAAEGLTREAALAQVTGSDFLDRRRADLTTAFARLEGARADLDALRAASPLERLAMPQRLADTALIAATWADFRPAIPTTTDGLMTAIAGYLGGWLGTAGLLGLILRPFRRPRTA